MSTQSVSPLVLRAMAFAVAVLSLGGTAFAEPAEPADPSATEAPTEEKVSFSGDMTLASRYLFQGLDYSDGRAVLQPNVNLGHGPFTANVWANYQVNIGELNEVDLSLKVGKSFGVLSAAAGYMNLQYPNRPDWDPSQEIFTELAVETALSPTLSMHYDFDAGQGSYTTLGISQSVGSSVTVASNLFYQSQYYELTGFPAAEFKVSASRRFGAYTLTPAVSYFATWANGDFRGDSAVPSNWLFGANVARAF